MSNLTTSCLVVMLMTIVSNTTSSQSLFPYLQDSLYGYADSSGVLVVEPSYEQVSLFGSDEMMVFLVNRKEYYNTNKPWPENLALAYKDSLYYLINNKGELINEKGATQPFKFKEYKYHYSYSKDNVARYLVIQGCTDTGWGIWDNVEQKTEGLVYTSWKGRQQTVRTSNIFGPNSDSQNNESINKRYKVIENANHDLNPFRSGIGRRDNLISDCDCTLARRKDGSLEILSPYGELVQQDIVLPNKESWASLAKNERKTLVDKELKSQCRYKYRPESKETNSKKKQRRLTPEIFMQERKQFRDSISQLTRKNYHETKQFGISLRKKWTCGLDTLNKRIDIITDKGKIVHSAKATSIPKSVSSNRLFQYNAVFVKGDDKRVLLSDNGKELFPSNSYYDIRTAGHGMHFGFIKKDAAYPLHIFDNDWKRYSNYDIYGISRNGTALVKDKKGNYFCTKLAILNESLEPIEKGDYKLLTFSHKKTKPPLAPEDKIPYSYSAENGPPSLRYDCIGGLENVDSAQHPRLLIDVLKQQNHRNRRRIRTPNFYVQDKPKNKKRVLAIIDNSIHLDTIVDKFVSVTGDLKAVKVLLGDSIQTIPLKDKYKSFFKTKMKNMYTMSNGERYELRGADDSIVASIPLKEADQYSLRPQALCEDRNILILDKKKLLILDDDGKLLMTIDRFDPSWQFTSPSNVRTYMPIDYELFGKTFIKINDIKPYLINLNILKVYKAMVR